MKNIKSFDLFQNEELDPNTYLSAADKLKNKGHISRANKLVAHSKDVIDKSLSEIKPLEIEMYGETFILWPQSIVIDGNEESGCMNIEIPFTQVSSSKLPRNTEDNENSLYFSFYKDEDGEYEEISVDGLALPNRIAAVKVLKVVKEFCKKSGNEKLNKELAKVSVNDIYEEF